MNHPHHLLQRLRLELAHGEDPLVEPGAGAGPQGFLKRQRQRKTETPALMCVKL